MKIINKLKSLIASLWLRYHPSCGGAGGGALVACLKPSLWGGLVGLLLLASCSQDDTDALDGDPVAVQFSSGIVAQPRLVGDTWTAGDAIGIFMLRENTALASGNIADNADNVQYDNTSGNSFAPVGTPIYYPQNSAKVDFVSYYPYTSPLTDYKLPIDVTDQSDPAKIDVLYSNKVTGKSKSNAPIDLQFDHAMSKLSFTLTAGVGAPDLTGAEIEVSKLYRKADFRLVDGEVENLLDENVVVANDNASIIIPPQSTSNNVLTITLANGDYFEWNFPVNTEFKKGKNHPYTITVDRTGISVSTGNITNWDSSGAVTEGDTAIRYRVGDYYPDPDVDVTNPAEKAKIQGVVFWLDPNAWGYDDGSSSGSVATGYFGKIVSLDERYTRWSGVSILTGASDHGNGMVNMRTLLQKVNNPSNIFENYPSFEFADALNTQWGIATNGYTDASAKGIWYVPALNELSALYDAFNTYGKFDFNTKLTVAGGMGFQNNWNWSSSENGGNLACLVSFNDGNTAYNGGKTSNRSVRAVSAF